MRVRIKSQAEEKAARAELEFRRLPASMLAVAEQGAEYLREHDSYQNRTGNLRRSTQALATFGPGELRVTLEMDEPYASFVANLGYSQFEAVAVDVKRNMDRAVAGIARRIHRQAG